MDTGTPRTIREEVRNSHIVRRMISSESIDTRKQGWRIDSCGQAAAWFRDSLGFLRTSHARCRHRLCPICGRIRANELGGKLRDVIQSWDSLRFITLTQKSEKLGLKEQIKSLLGNFRRLRQHRDWKKHVRAAAYTIEITYNPSRDTWHPHLHVLADGEFWAQREISACWEKASRGSCIVDIRMPSDRKAAVGYIVAYVSKSQSPGKLPDRRFDEWVAALKGLRMISLLGKAYAKPRENLSKLGVKFEERLGFVRGVEEMEKRGNRAAYSLLHAVYSLSPAPKLESHHLVGGKLKDEYKLLWADILAEHARVIGEVREFCNPSPYPIKGEVGPPVPSQLSMWVDWNRGSGDTSTPNVPPQ